MRLPRKSQPRTVGQGASEPVRDPAASSVCDAKVPGGRRPFDVLTESRHVDGINLQGLSVRRLAVAIEFNASKGATLGVEWELQLIDAESMHLRQDAREVLAAL